MHTWANRFEAGDHSASNGNSDIGGSLTLDYDEFTGSRLRDIDCSDLEQPYSISFPVLDETEGRAGAAPSYNASLHNNPVFQYTGSGASRLVRGLWYCHNCGFGPNSGSVDVYCPSCHHIRIV